MGHRSETPTRLGQILRKEGRKQKWLADQIGVDEVTLHRYVYGLRHVPQPKRELIAEALGRKASDVFPESTEAAA